MLSTTEVLLRCRHSVTRDFLYQLARRGDLNPKRTRIGTRDRWEYTERDADKACLMWKLNRVDGYGLDAAAAKAEEALAGRRPKGA